MGFADSGAGRVPQGVLVIDDHAEVREMIVALLARLGWGGRQAADGAEGLALMEAAQAEIGLALVDVVLPDTDGVSVARQLRARYPRLAIVLLSGRLNDESRWVVSEDGFRFLPKPFALEQLRDVVAEALGDPDSASPA
jgi:DNA-binding response OmpR family regulator